MTNAINLRTQPTECLLWSRWNCLE